MTAAAGGKDLWVVGGGDLAGQFADAGLLDEVITYVAPVTLGSGRPLLPRRLELRLEETAAEQGVHHCAVLGRRTRHLGDLTGRTVRPTVRA